MEWMQWIHTQDKNLTVYFGYQFCLIDGMDAVNSLFTHEFNNLHGLPFLLSNGMDTVSSHNPKDASLCFGYSILLSNWIHAVNS